MSSMLIYGAYGYSGRQILDAAVKRGLNPIAAGRDPQQTEALAREFGVAARSFALDDQRAVDAGLKGVSLVMHCAGPFSATAKAMLDGCIRAGAHYLDLCGEYKVIEAVAARDAQLKSAGVMAMSAVGMDVVPTDCLAAHMKQRMPEATRLDIYVRALEQLSRGTATTMVEGAGLPNVVRENGVLVEKRAGADRRKVAFPGKQVSMVSMVSVPWGDIATAYRTTGIPNIATHMSLMPGAPIAIAIGGYFGWLTQTAFMQRLLKGLVKRFVTGPSVEHQAANRAEFIAEVRDGKGRTLSSYLTTQEGYAFTNAAAVEICARVLAGEARPGFQTPGGLFGADFVLSIPGSARKDLV